jgi:hypothetical protein
MPANYSILKQTVDHIRDIENSPSISMWPYLVSSAQTKLLNKISVYMEVSELRQQVRVLYLNDTALEIWRAMKRATEVVGEVHRPPKGAQLIFGMPFGE